MHRPPVPRSRPHTVGSMNLMSSQHGDKGLAPLMETKTSLKDRPTWGRLRSLCDHSTSPLPYPASFFSPAVLPERTHFSKLLRR